MRKLFIVFLPVFLLLSSVAMAEETTYADACHKPKEFTVDKRCYVTDKQKKVLPYSSVADLVYKGDWSYCTGTFVYGVSDKKSLFNFTKDNGLVYLFTAKHCTDGDGAIRVKTQKGKTLDLYLVRQGDYSSGGDRRGDWAIYKLNDDIKNDKEFLKKEIGVVNTDSIFMANDRSVKLVGYGGLKIMSDKEIAQFKEDYIKYIIEDAGKKGTQLKRSDVEGDSTYFNTRTGGIDRDNPYLTGFVKKLESENKNIFQDKDLKVSTCTYSNNVAKGCQSWSGNSGGPVFDSDNNLVGIHNAGYGEVGGTSHAQSAYDVSIININNKYMEKKNDEER